MIKFFKKLAPVNRLINVFITLLPSFIALVAILVVFFYAFAIIGVSLYGSIFANFANLGSALFVLVQAFTLDGWASTIARPVMSVYPYAWIYFSSFVLLSGLVVVSFIVSAIKQIKE